MIHRILFLIAPLALHSQETQDIFQKSIKYLPFTILLFTGTPAQPVLN